MCHTVGVERKLGELMTTTNSPRVPVDIERVIRRIRNAPRGASLTEIVEALRRDGIPTDIIFLCYKAANILDDAAAEDALRRALGHADTDPPPAPPTLSMRKVVKP